MAPTTTTVEPRTTTSVAPPAAPPPTSGPAPHPAPRPAAGLVARPALVGVDGMYVVRRDGTGLRRMITGCDPDAYRYWLDDDDLLVRGHGSATARQVRIDGTQRPLPMPTVTDRDGTTERLPPGGSPSPGGRRLAISFGGLYLQHGVALVDRDAQVADVVLWGDNPVTAWSPTGSHVLLVGGQGWALLDSKGAMVRKWAPSPITFDVEPVWSPDGRLVLAPKADDPNAYVVLDPFNDRAWTLPRIEPSGNSAVWAGAGRIVIGDYGIDHQRAPAIHVHDLGGGGLRRLATEAGMPAAPADGRVVAFHDMEDHRQIELITPAGTGRSTLVRGDADGMWVWPHSWSPDGEWLSFDACSERSGGDGGLPSA